MILLQRKFEKLHLDRGQNVVEIGQGKRLL